MDCMAKKGIDKKEEIKTRARCDRILCICKSLFRVRPQPLSA
jgi:hypothetical protein